MRNELMRDSLNKATGQPRDSVIKLAKLAPRLSCLQYIIENSCIKEVIIIPQVSKLEDELVRSCNIRQIKELLNSNTNDEFKHDVLGVTNLDAKLRQHQFDINKFWTSTPPAPYQNIPNQAAKVKR